MYCMVHGGKTECAMSIHLYLCLISLMFVEHANKATVCFLRNLFMLRTCVQFESHIDSNKTTNGLRSLLVKAEFTTLEGTPMDAHI